MVDYLNFYLVYLFTWLTVFPVSLTAQSDQNALHFDGIDDYVNLDVLAGELAGSTSFTIEFRMKADRQEQSGIRTAMFAINDLSNSGNVLLLVMGGTGNVQEGKLILADNKITPENFVITSTQVIGDGSCHHIAYVRDGGSGSLFLDGIAVGTHAVSYSLTPDLQYSIGQEWDWGVASDFFRGTIDELRIWKVARDQKDLNETMFSILPDQEPGLIAWYHFNQGNAKGDNTGIEWLEDGSGNGRHAALENFSLTGDQSNFLPDSCIWFDCMNVPFGPAVIDTCGQCLLPDSPGFNKSCSVIPGLYIPDAFSPNGDGLNDVFRVYPEPGATGRIVKFEIYSRWGELLFTAGPLDLHSEIGWWDGTFRRQPMQNGVYVYQIRTAWDNGIMRDDQGWLMIVR